MMTMTNMMKTDVARLLEAASFAAFKHRDQRRKDADATPYINHPLDVALHWQFARLTAPATAPLTRALQAEQPAFFTFTDKGHDLWASVTGRLSVQTDRAVIDRLWNPFVAAWYEGGKDDPKLALLRFDAEHAEIWLNEHSLLAGVKMLLGVDPKRDYADKNAEVDLT